MKNGFAWFLILAALVVISAQYIFAAEINLSLENGVFLGHDFVKYQSSVDKVPSVAEKMAKEYNCRYLFVNAGLGDSNGLFKDSPQELSKAIQFLNSIADYERKSGYKFKVLAWYNAETKDTDISKSEIRQNIVNECKKLISPDVNGSYIVGSRRSFDGICLDIEPCGKDEVLFNSYIQLCNEISKAIKTFDKDKIVSVCGQRYGNESKWQWNAEEFYRMAASVDLTIVMEYDTGIKTTQEYQDWICKQTNDILNAVGGKYCKTANPQMNEDTKIMIAFAAYPPKKWHKPDVENAKNGAIGVLRALDELKKDKQNQCEKYFLGAAMYRYADMTGNENYSSESIDWHDFKQYWLLKL